MVNITKAFEKNYAHKIHPRRGKRPMGDEWTKKDKIACRNCKWDWGIEAEWKGLATFPLLKMEGFRIKDPVTEKVMPLKKQWKDACFRPQKADLSELLGNDI